MAESPGLSKCPRCESSLIKAQNDMFCPKNHGAFFSLDGLRVETSPSFDRSLFGAWYRRANLRTVQCPGCRTRMIQLNIKEPQSFELDCCPNCFGLWLDTGEESLLQKIFYEHTKSVPVTDFSSEQSAALGKLVMAQENVLRR